MKDEISAFVSIERIIELERKDAAREAKFEAQKEEACNQAVRRALENAAQEVEKIAGTRNYEQAYKKAAVRIRSLKPA